MAIGCVTHDDFLLHENSPGHPERPDRLRAIRRAFDQRGLTDRLTPIEPAHADPDRIARIHDPDYIASVEAASHAAADTRRPVRLDPDTSVVAASYDAARLATGGTLAAVDAVMSGRVGRAFCAHRPPGHHAERDHAMGFCLFNHVAIAADYLTDPDTHALKRVAVVDFDVHHGNGTQHSFDHRPDVLFISIHQDPRTLYPGTGFARETGVGPGAGFTLNVPMPPGSGDDDYARAFDKLIIPKLTEFAPQFLLISAGFDAAAEDPLANIDLTDAAFTTMTRKLVAVADRWADGRVVSVLEGGYDLGALARCAVAHVEALES